MPDLIRTVEKVKEFASLELGWRLGEGVPPPLERIGEAIKWLAVARNLGILRMNAFAGPEGEIQVTFHYEDSMLELTLERDGTITIAEDVDDTLIDFRKFATTDEAFSSLRGFAQKIWDTSELSLTRITIPKSAASIAWRFVHQVTMAESRSLRASARRKTAGRSVSTSPNTIQIKLVGQSSFGRYQMKWSQVGADSSPPQALQEMSVTSISTIGTKRTQRNCLRS